MYLQQKELRNSTKTSLLTSIPVCLIISLTNLYPSDHAHALFKRHSLSLQLLGSQYFPKTIVKEIERVAYSVKVMSSSRRPTCFTNDELNDLASKLVALLPHSNSSCTTRVPASEILKQTCNYINRLQREVNDLRDRLAQLLASMDSNSVELEVLRNLLH